MQKMELTFWWKDKQPGEVIEVRDEDVRAWRGFARPLPDSEQPAPESRSAEDKAPSRPDPAAKAKAAAPPKG